MSAHRTRPSCLRVMMSTMLCICCTRNYLVSCDNCSHCWWACSCLSALVNHLDHLMYRSAPRTHAFVDSCDVAARSLELCWTYCSLFVHNYHRYFVDNYWWRSCRNCLTEWTLGRHCWQVPAAYWRRLPVALSEFDWPATVYCSREVVRADIASRVHHEEAERSHKC